jgi:hypothetical protein
VDFLKVEKVDKIELKIFIIYNCNYTHTMSKDYDTAIIVDDAIEFNVMQKAQARVGEDGVITLDN